MKKIPQAAIAVCLLFLLPTLLWAETAQEKKAAKIDLDKTVALYEGWLSRPSFPETVPFAYYPVYAMQAMGKEISKEKKEKIVAFLKSCQKQDGGFANEPQYAKESNVIFTYHALQALSLLEALDAIDRAKALSYLTGLQQKDGGFKASAGGKGKPTLDATYYGVQSLVLLDGLKKVDKKKTTALVANHRKKGSGFSKQPGTAPSPQSTFMGVRTLKTLGALTDEITTEVKAYLGGTRYTGRPTDRKYYSLPTIREMSFVLRTLDDLSALKEVADTKKVEEFVTSLYIPVNGGFGPQPGYGTTPPSTYHGIVCLVQLGKLKDPLRS